MAKKYSTSTVRSDGTIVPWLAARGPLAYSPETPPVSNYFFQYGWLMPRVYSDKRHYYFGKPSSLSLREIDWGIQPFVDFWSKARAREIEQIVVVNGRRNSEGFLAPIACYRYYSNCDKRDTYLLIQHGSYLPVNVEEQPLLKEGMLILYRGIGNWQKFRWRACERPSLSGKEDIFQRYFAAHQQTFSDAEVSFQVAHARVKRCETSFLACNISWADIARDVGFDWESSTLGRWLVSAHRQSFTLLQQTAAWKFGPNYIRCSTPITNVRITSFFAGESEVNVIDPWKVEILTPRTSRSTFACIVRSNFT